MAKANRTDNAQRPRAARPRQPSRVRRVASRKCRQAVARWRSNRSGQLGDDLVFDVREPKLAVSLRLDADVLRFFRGFGAGYQTRINEVLKAFMQAQGRSANGAPFRCQCAGAQKRSVNEGKRAR